jgi:murein DD-endopeptidase MepM/ murein hydrolase activator NlpD
VRAGPSYGPPVLRLTVVLSLLLVVAPAADAAPWRWPVPPREPARGFAVGPERFAAGQHRGIDIPAPLGTPVRAACPGTVRFAGTVGDAGLTVSVACGELVATYLHLGGVYVRRGLAVRRGTVLGRVGRSGRPRGAPHLHLGARRASDGRYVDPLPLLGRVGAPGVPPGGAPPLGRAPRPGLQRRPVRTTRPAPTPAASPAPAPAIPWAALAGLGLLVATTVPAAAARRRRERRARGHPEPAPARR